MSKLILTAALAAAALGVAGCKNEQTNEANAAMNAEEVNYADNMMANENMTDMNDMNMTNDMGNATDGNAATDNKTGY